MKKPLEVLRLYLDHDYTLNGAFASRAVRNAERELVFYDGRSTSWQAFGEAIERCARLLLARGVKKGERIAAMARTCDGHVLALFAAARIGAIVVPVNPEFGAEEAKYVFHHAEICAVLAARDTLAVARQAAEGLRTEPWFASFDAATDGVPLLSDLMDHVPRMALPHDISADDTVLIVYTSGTTTCSPKALTEAIR